jgi:hypothetical protein
MLSRPLVTVLLVASADALRVDTISRRALLGKATAGVLAAGPLAAFAAEVKTKLEQASDGEVYERATQGNLGVARVIKRAEEGTLVLGKGANCPNLERIIAVDKQAIQFEKDKLETWGDRTGPDAEEQRRNVKTIETRIEVQVKRLADVQKAKGCGAEDAAIYLRPDEGKLNSARVIYRAKEGRAVGQLGKTCKELDALIAIDKDALQFEKNKLLKLQANGMPEAKTQIKIVEQAEKSISAQIRKLEKKKEGLSVDMYGVEGC